jgi:hypothetical protein
MAGRGAGAASSAAGGLSAGRGAVLLVVEGWLDAPAKTAYGLDEGAHVDPDGNLIRFGAPPLPRRALR